MKHKKTLGIIVAMALVAVISVAGTLAYLQKTTGPVTNTFSASGLLDDDTNFELKEHRAKADTTNPGQYTLENTVEVTANTYDKVVPGVDVKKDPFVRIKANALQTDAWLFVEVASTLPNTLTYSINMTNWEELTGVNTHTRPSAGQTVTVYAYKGKLTPDDNTAEIVKEILADNKITVDASYVGGTGEELVFNAFLTQAAGFSTAKAAWNATYGAATP